MSSDGHTAHSGAEAAVWRGVGAAAGVAFGPALVIRGSVDEIPGDPVASEDVTAEVVRFGQAMADTREQLAALREEVRVRVSGNEAAIFDSHLMVLGDPQFVERTVETIRARACNAESAVRIVSAQLGGKLAVMTDENPDKSYGWDTQKGTTGLLLGRQQTAAYLARVLE